MDELLKIFQYATSGDSNLIKESSDLLSKIICEENLYINLFTILMTPNFANNIYFCAAGALRMWFTRNWCSSETNLSIKIKKLYIGYLQKAIVFEHPCHKILLYLYKICHPSILDPESFYNYFESIVPLVGAENISRKDLVCILSTIIVVVQSTSRNLKSNFPNCLELYDRLQRRLFDLMKVYIVLDDEVDCVIIRYCLKIMSICIYRYLFDRDAINVYVRMINEILNDFPLIRFNGSREYYLLIRFCGKFLNTLTNYNSQFKISNDLSFMIINLCIGFLNKLSPIFDVPRMTLSIFFAPFSSYELSNQNISCELVQLFINCSQLTPFETSDFNENPVLFIDYAYGKNSQNPRRKSADISSYLATSDQRFVQILLNKQQSEASMYIMSMIVHCCIDCGFDQQIKTWIMQCMNFINSSPIFFSTFLYLIYKSFSLFDNDCIEQFYPLVLEGMSNDNLVILCISLKCFRKMLELNIDFPSEILNRIINFASVCPTNDASKTLQILMEKYPDLTSSISNQIIEAIFTGIISTLSSSVEDNDYSQESIKKSLDVLSQIVNEFGSKVVSRNLIDAVTLLLINYEINYDFSDSLTQLIVFILLKSDEYSTIMLINLINAIEQNSNLINEMSNLYITFISFMSFKTQNYLSLQCNQKVYQLGLIVISKDYNDKSVQAGTELVCWSLQLDNSLDYTLALRLIPSIYSDNFRYQIIATIIITNNVQIENEVLDGMLHFLEKTPCCYYEKKLYSLALLNICLQNKDLSNILLPVALDLYKKLKEQLEILGKMEVPFQCDHNFQTPIESIDIVPIIENAINNCSQSKQKEYLNAFSQII